MPDREVAATVEVVEAATPDLVDAFARLLPQLSRSAPALSRQALEEIEREAANRLYRRLGFQLRDSRLYRFTP